MKITLVGALRFVPRMTRLRNLHCSGAMLVIVGAAGVLTVKFVPLETAPPGVTTTIGPALPIAPAGMLVTVICVEELTVKPNCCTGMPLMSTALAPVKFVPLMTTLAPGAPLVGVRPAMVGAALAVTVKLELLVTMLPAETTVIGPLVAPAGTMARIGAIDNTLRGRRHAIEQDGAEESKLVPD